MSTQGGGLWRGTLGAVIICAATIAVAPLDGRVAGLVAPVTAGTYAVLLSLRGRTPDLVALTVWLWLLVPFVRRMVDWLSTYHEISPILLAPVVSSLAAAVLLLRGRGARASTAAAVMPAAMVLAVAYGTVVGLPRWGLFPVLAAVVELVAPLVLGYVALSHNGAAVAECLPRLARVAIPVIGAYGILQFLVLPPWDAMWIEQSGINSVGQAEALQVRVFGTLNTAGPYAHTISALLLLDLAGRRRPPLPVHALVLTVGYLGLALSLVRSAWLCHLVGLAVLLVAGRVHLRPLLLTVVPAAVAFMVWGGPLLESVSTRVTSSLEAGTQDYSAQERISLQTELLGELILDPWGRGLGATGLATQFDQSLDPALQSVDSGLFEATVTFGLPAALLLLGATVVAAVSAAARARRGLADPGAAAVLTALTAALLFTSTYKSVYGAVLWLAVGVAGHVGPIRNPSAEDEVGHDRTEPASSALSHAVSAGGASRARRP